MKPGDLVLVIGTETNTETIGTLIEPWVGCGGWWTVMLSNGDLVNWPESRMEPVIE